MRALRPLLEPLEPRTLLSVAPTLAPLFTSIGHAGPEARTGGPTSSSGPAIHLKKGVGHNITLPATVSTTVEVAFFPSPVLDPPGVYSASITWGDGATSTATLTYATENGKGGYQITGTHAYANPGSYKINTVVTETFGSTGGIAIATPIRLVARIASKATVTPAPSDTGVIIHEVANRAFTATLGTFVAIVPATTLTASINWGDGHTSAGTLINIHTGLDTITYQVTGSHTYASNGTYTIVTTITRAATANVATPYRTLTTTAIVAAPNLLSLTGSIAGTYSFAPTAVDVGSTDVLTGFGTAGDLGSVSLSGTLTFPGFILPATQHGTITLTNSQGSVTLQLTSALATPLSTTASTLAYAITGGTGAYTNATAFGSVSITLTANAGNGTNTFELTFS